MTRRITYFVSRETIAIHLNDGTSGSVSLKHRDIDTIRDILNKPEHADEDVEAIRAYIDAAAPIKAAAALQEGDLMFTGSEILFRGKALNLEATRRIVEIAANGFAIDRFLKFLNKLLNNPYPSAVEELWQFMEASQLPITEDGDLVAYKTVRNDYKDHYTGTFDNSIGQTPEVKPFEVDQNRHNTCSRGLHVCGKDYLPHYGACTTGGDRIMIVTVDPAHVVSVPVDYAFHKMRCWKYTVVGEIEGREKAGILESRGIYNVGDRKDVINYGDMSDEDRAAAIQAVDNEGWSKATIGGQPMKTDVEIEAERKRKQADAASTSFFVQDEFDSEVYHPATVDEVRQAMSGSASFDIYTYQNSEYVAVTDNLDNDAEGDNDPDADDNDNLY